MYAIETLELSKDFHNEVQFTKRRENDERY
jgi:hypothetical protein